MAGDRAYEMLWDCGYCGAQKLLGKSQKFCPQCGAPQDTQARYFPDEPDKVEVLGHRYEGADKICPACQAPNGALAEFCGRCGSPLSEAARAKRLQDQVRADEAKFAASLSLRQQEAERRRHPAAVAPPARTGNQRLYLWVAVALSVLGLVLALLFWTRQETVVVSGHYWRQAIQIERYGPVAESAWCDSMPFAAYGVARHSEIRSYQQIPDGQDCQMRRVDRGDGTFTEHQECRPKYRSEPVYDQRCDYRIDRWSWSREASAEGHDLAPRWPSTGLAAARPCLGCEREGGRESRFEVLLRGQGREYRCGLAQEAWRGMRDGSRWTLKVGAVDKQPRCDSLKPVD